MSNGDGQCVNPYCLNDERLCNPCGDGRCASCDRTDATPSNEPAWGPRTDSQRLDWLIENCGDKTIGLSGNPKIDREAIDDAIAREECRGK